MAYLTKEMRKEADERSLTARRPAEGVQAVQSILLTCVQLTFHW